jgi:hypothetical protein
MELIAAIGFFTTIAIAALAFGTDSRERYVSKEEILASHGFRWDDGPTDEVLAAELVAARANRESAVSPEETALPRHGNLRPTEA